MDRPDSLHVGFLGIAGPMDSSCSSRSLCGHLLCDVHCSSCLLCQGYRNGWCSDCWAQGAPVPIVVFNETWLFFLLLTSGLNPGTPSAKGILAGIYIYIYIYIFFSPCWLLVSWWIRKSLGAHHPLHWLDCNNAFDAFWAVHDRGGKDTWYSKMACQNCWWNGLYF